MTPIKVEGIRVRVHRTAHPTAVLPVQHYSRMYECGARLERHQSTTCHTSPRTPPGIQNFDAEMGRKWCSRRPCVGVTVGGLKIKIGGVDLLQSGRGTINTRAIFII
jgi:hypothetical protein